MKILILMLMLVSSAFAQTRSPFWELYAAPTIPEKKAIWAELTRDERIDAQRMNFAWAAGRLELNAEQTEYLTRLSAALPTMNRRQRDLFRDQAVTLFPVGGDLLFGSIGPYKPCNPFLHKSIVMQPQGCPCSIGSYFNMSCDGDCTVPGGRCSTQPDGCGFLYLYACNGYCQLG